MSRRSTGPSLGTACSVAGCERKSVGVRPDGTRVNRWEDPGKRGHARVGYERRFEAVQAFLAGEEPDGRWF